MNFVRPLNRPWAKSGNLTPVNRMVTHAILAPMETHWKKATCEEYGCLPFHHGWSVNTAGMSAHLVHRAKKSGRKFIIEHDAAGSEVLIFEPGQPCFRVSEHRVRIQRPEFFVRRNGDWRGNPDGPHATPMVFSGADSWHDSVGTTLDGISVVE